ncbi:MAG: FHA domain-containing protein, partial [Deltaproteobacteria bacterium]|nr:FHA domain-containing protein [Deltaproteobacteria bacterium]
MAVFEKEIPVDAYFFIDIDGKIFRYHFKRRTTLIGRDSSNDVIINHSNVLEHHATMTFSRGMFLLTPIENGLVKLNGERVEDTTPVNSCDCVTIGGFDCQFAVDNGVSETALLMICRREKGDFWIASRQTMLFVGKEKGDIFIPDDSLVKSP